jgi:riboflavin kinase/FMN adenylyltransferase
MTDWYSMSLDFRVYKRLEDVPPHFGPSALTIGNFDGVHAGHRQIMARVVKTAAENGWRASVLTFDPHPTRVVAPDRAPKLMTSPAQRTGLMRSAGIQQVLVLPFDRTVAAWTPDYFVREILVRRLQARVVLVGEDFRFGHKHAGDTKLLRDLGRELGFRVELVPAVTLKGSRVSSSLVRELLEQGKVARAARFLQQPFGLEGSVVRGHGIGSKQTVPTLNLSTECEVLPKTGVYVTRTCDLESARAWRSITNIGYRPTFQGDALTIETFLLDPLDAAPSRIRVNFLHRLRDERKFESPEALKSQILKDVGRANIFFRRLSRIARA